MDETKPPPAGKPGRPSGPQHALDEGPGVAQRGPDGLTEFERAVCHAVDEGLSDRAAFRKADPFSKANDVAAAHAVMHLRRRPHCAAYLAELKAKSLARHLARKDKLIEELAAVAFANLGDFLITGPDGLAVRPVEALSPAQLAGLAAVTITRSATGASVRLRLHDKMAALDKLAKLFGLYDGPAAGAAERAVAEMSDTERAQRLAAILRLAGTAARPDDPAGTVTDEGPEAEAVTSMQARESDEER